MNLFIVFLVSGLWHGASWTFVIWGAIHGAYQVIGKLTEKPRRRLIERTRFTEKSSAVVIPRRIITFILVCFAWIFFRANSLADASLLLEKLFVSGWGRGFGETLSLMGLDTVGIIMTACSLITLFMIDEMLKYEDSPSGGESLTKNGSFIYYVWIILFAWAILLSQGVGSTFIYFQF
jgi:D-alanyl-lipoteichoic acid acyltransferase DltB (MBOAT superfamily)